MKEDIYSIAYQCQTIIKTQVKRIEALRCLARERGDRRVKRSQMILRAKYFNGYEKEMLTL